MSAKRSDLMLGELMAVISDYLEAPEDDLDLVGRVRCWISVATGQVCASDSAGRLAGGPAPVHRDRVLVDLLKARPSITTTELARRAAICGETARLYLRSLAGRRVVRKVGDKRGARYIAGVHFGDFAKTLGNDFGDKTSGESSGNSSGNGEGVIGPAQASPAIPSGLPEVLS